VFVRALPDATRGLGGTALQNSFMIGVPAAGATDPSAEAPRGTIAHEMGHMFVGQISGVGETGAPWFAEGLNVHYTRLVLLRSGLAPVSQYVTSVNETARQYYSNKFRNESAASLDRIGFSAGVGGGGAQNVPYTRGSLYFATVDFKIRDASGGKRSLDSVMLPLFAQRRGGKPFTTEHLLNAFAEAYGPSARSDFDSIIVRGETVVPPSGAFGPCLDRRPATFTVQERQADGYEWFRVESVPDERCRQW
jgi:predicted metalloprotease with PDZ domain